VEALEPTSAGKRGLELRDMWQHQSSPHQGGEVWHHGTHGSAGAHLGMEARFGVVGHMAAPESTSAERQGSGHKTRGSTGAHLCREVWSRATEYVVA
jgi:hypothetical protein